MHQATEIIAFASFALLMTGSGWSQESIPPPVEPNETEVVDEASDASDDETDVLQTDDESYRDIDDQDFTPTEEIPTDQSITFPTDI